MNRRKFIHLTAMSAAAKRAPGADSICYTPTQFD